MQRRVVKLLIALASLPLGGCVGQVDGGMDDGPSPVVPGGMVPTTPGGPQVPGATTLPPAPPPSAATATGGRPVVRLLAREELRNTLEDLLSVTVAEAELPYADAPVTAFASTPADFVGATDFDRLDKLTVGAAATYVKRVQGSAQKCADGNAACLEAFLSAHARRIFRRPIEPAELAAYRGLYDAEKARAGHDAGLALAIAGMLQSPFFLYRTEIGAPTAGGLNRLTDWEYASALSFLIARTTPDDALLDAAGGGKLRTAEGVRAEVKRLLGGKRGKQGVLDFYTRWVTLQEYDGRTKDAKLFPTFNAAFKAAALRELSETVEREVLSGQGSWKNLLTTRKGFVDATLAPVYRATAPAQPGLVELDATRAGVFTQVAFLSATSTETDTHPLHAGKVIFEQVLCQAFPPPPENPFLIPWTPDPTKTRRQNMDARTAGGNCVGCHRVLNPVAFPFDAYDPLGRSRTTLDGMPIDSSGEIVGTTDADGRFANVPEMMRKLAGSAQASACHVQHWLRYALGRAETDDDARSIARAHDAFAKGGFDVLTMVTELVLSDSFVYRRKS